MNRLAGSSPGVRIGAAPWLAARFVSAAPPKFGIQTSGRGRGGGRGIGSRGVPSPSRKSVPAASLASLDDVLAAAESRPASAIPHASPATPSDSAAERPKAHVKVLSAAPEARPRVAPLVRPRSAAAMALSKISVSVAGAVTQQASSLADAILRAWSVNGRVIGVQGSTGCGKSSLVPLQIAELLAQPLPGAEGTAEPAVVWVAQPTRVACVSLAQHVAGLIGCKIGTAVGYAVGDGDVVASQGTRVVFSTAGYLARHFGHDRLGRSSGLPSRADAVIIDEVHAGSEDMQLLFVVLRAMGRGSDAGPKLALMSATFDAACFQHAASFLRERCGPIALLNMGSEKFPVEVHHAGSLPESLLRVDAALADACAGVCPINPDVHPGRLMKAVVRLVNALIQSHRPDNFSSSVLVFLPGFLEIDGVARMMASAAMASEWHSSAGDAETDATEDMLRLRMATGTDVEVLLVHGSAFSAASRSAMRRKLATINSEHRRSHDDDRSAAGPIRVYLATNVFESSVTLPDARYVIDAALSRVDASNTAGDGKLQTQLATVSSVTQRIGRVGRTGPGWALTFHPEWAAATDRPVEDKPWHVSALCRALLVGFRLPVVRSSNLAIGDCICRDLTSGGVDHVLALLCGAKGMGIINASATGGDWLALRIESVRVTHVGAIAVDLPLPLPLALFVSVACLAGAGANAVLAVAIELPHPAGGAAAQETVVDALHARSVFLRDLSGESSDVWQQRNLGLALLRTPPRLGNRKVQGNARDPSPERTALGKRIGVSASLLAAFSDTVRRIAQKLSMALASSNCQLLVAEARNLAMLVELESGMIEARSEALSRLFPAAYDEHGREKLKAVFFACFGSTCVVGHPQVAMPPAVRQSLRVATPTLSMLQRVYVAPIALGGSRVSSAQWPAVVAAFDVSLPSILEATTSPALRSAMQHARVCAPGWLVLVLSRRYAAKWCGGEAHAADLFQQPRALPESAELNRDRMLQPTYQAPLAIAMNGARLRKALTTHVVLASSMLADGGDDEALLDDVPAAALAAISWGSPRLSSTVEAPASQTESEVIGDGQDATIIGAAPMLDDDVLPALEGDEPAEIGDIEDDRVELDAPHGAAAGVGAVVACSIGRLASVLQYQWTLQRGEDAPMTRCTWRWGSAMDALVPRIDPSSSLSGSALGSDVALVSAGVIEGVDGAPTRARFAWAWDDGPAAAAGLVLSAFQRSTRVAVLASQDGLEVKGLWQLGTGVMIAVQPSSASGFWSMAKGAGSMLDGSLDAHESVVQLRRMLRPANWACRPLRGEGDLRWVDLGEAAERAVNATLLWAATETSAATPIEVAVLVTLHRLRAVEVRSISLDRLLHEIGLTLAPRSGIPAPQDPEAGAAGNASQNTDSSVEDRTTQAPSLTDLALTKGYAGTSDMLKRGLGCFECWRGHVLVPRFVPTSHIPAAGEVSRHVTL